MIPITREFLQIGARLEATANPGKGKQYEVTLVRPKSWHSSYITYQLQTTNQEKTEWKDHLTLNYLQKYYKRL